MAHHLAVTVPCYTARRILHLLVALMVLGIPSLAAVWPAPVLKCRLPTSS